MNLYSVNHVIDGAEAICVTREAAEAYMERNGAGLYVIEAISFADESAQEIKD
jgi:hypothetical protein